jgi:hypothetical protein
MTLSHTLADVAAGQTSFEELVPDLLVGESGDENEIWFGGMGDIASLDAGHFAVLDPMQRRVLLIDSLGGLVTTLGREGDGPGEFRQPWAVASVGDALVVRQNATNLAFTVFADGGLRSVAGAIPPDGDWDARQYRRPRFRITGEVTGPEDVTRRLQRFDDTSFVHMLQSNELATMDFVEPIEFRGGIPTFLVRYDMMGHILDTIAEVRGPPTFVDDMWPGRTIFYVQPLFSGRPVWTTGDGWYAIGHGDSTEVVVRDREGVIFLRIRIPARRRLVTEGDRADAADWRAAGVALTNSGYMERYRTGGAALRRRIRESMVSGADLTATADSIPHVTAAYGAGPCLFLSGFGPDDWQDGTSLTWVVLNVRERVVAGTIRLRPPLDGSFPEFPAYSRNGAAVRDFDRHFAFTFRRMADGAAAVERFRLPDFCEQ